MRKTIISSRGRGEGPEWVEAEGGKEEQQEENTYKGDTKYDMIGSVNYQNPLKLRYI